MPTVKELRDSFNTIIEANESNADLDVVVCITLKSGMNDTFAMDIHSLGISENDESDEKFVSLSLKRTFVEMSKLGAAYADRKMQEYVEKEKVDKICVQ